MYGYQQEIATTTKTRGLSSADPKSFPLGHQGSQYRRMLKKIFYNSEISILIYSVGQKFKPEHCLEFLDYLFNFDQSDVKIAKLAQAGFQIDDALLLVRSSGPKLPEPQLSQRHLFSINSKYILSALSTLLKTVHQV